MRPALFSAALVLCFLSTASGADVIILITPKCPLDPKTVDLGDKSGPFPYHTLNSRKAPEFAEGASVKDVKARRETIVVELLKPTTTPGTRTEAFTLDGAKAAEQVTYKTVAIRQPYRVWYIKEAGAEPVKMAEGVATGEGSEVKPLRGTKVEIAKLTADALVRRGMVDVNENLADTIRNVFADKIIVGKPFYPTSSQVLNVRPLPGERPRDLPHFRPKKLAYGRNGEATVEIDLHNRLPLRVVGLVRRTRTLEEGRIESELLRAKKKTGLADSVEFDLDPGEKMTATVTVPAEFVTGAKHTAHSFILLSRVELSPRPRR